jgi:hypothetical protein
MDIADVILCDPKNPSGAPDDECRAPTVPSPSDASRSSTVARAAAVRPISTTALQRAMDGPREELLTPRGGRNEGGEAERAAARVDGRLAVLKSTRGLQIRLPRIDEDEEVLDGEGGRGKAREGPGEEGACAGAPRKAPGRIQLDRQPTVLPGKAWLRL